MVAKPIVESGATFVKVKEDPEVATAPVEEVQWAAPGTIPVADPEAREMFPVAECIEVEDESSLSRLAYRVKRESEKPEPDRNRYHDRFRIEPVDRGFVPVDRVLRPEEVVQVVRAYAAG